jgi:hypothetical protein
MPLRQRKHPGWRAGYNMKWGMTLYLYSQMIRSLRWRIVESYFWPLIVWGYFTFSFWRVIQIFLSCLNFRMSSVFESCFGEVEDLLVSWDSITPRINGSPAQYHLNVWNFSSLTIDWRSYKESISSLGMTEVITKRKPSKLNPTRRPSLQSSFDSGKYMFARLWCSSFYFCILIL